MLVDGAPAINAVLNGLKPVVDSVYAFDDAVEAFKREASGDFFCKIVIAPP